MTGLTHVSLELTGKRLELLKEGVPKVSRFAFFYDPSGTAGYTRVAKETQAIVRALGIQLDVIQVKAADPGFESVFRTMVNERIGAFLLESTPRMSDHRQKILELAEKVAYPRCTRTRNGPPLAVSCLTARVERSIPPHCRLRR